jgi:hypothetical protein
MVRKRIPLFRMACASAIFVLASCDSVGVYRMPKPPWGPKIGHGPPAHAKAHGYRRKHIGGHELVYDSSHGVYVVVGLANCYYHEGYFYRLRGDLWEVSLRADSGWGPTAHHTLPPGLQIKGRAKGHGKGRAKG